MTDEKLKEFIIENDAFEDRLEYILSCDKNKKKELFKNRLMTKFILRSFFDVTLDYKRANLKSSDIIYDVTYSYSTYLGCNISKSFYKKNVNYFFKLLPTLISKNLIIVNNGLYNITDNGKNYLELITKADSVFDLSYNSPYCDYFVFFLNNVKDMALTDKLLNDLSSMCKDSEFALYSFKYFKNYLDNHGLLKTEKFNDNNYYPYFERALYYQVILLLAVRGYNIS